MTTERIKVENRILVEDIVVEALMFPPMYCPARQRCAETCRLTGDRCEETLCPASDGTPVTFVVNWDGSLYKCDYCSAAYLDKEIVAKHQAKCRHNPNVPEPLTSGTLKERS